MQLQSVLALLGVYASGAIATPVAIPATTDPESIALASVQHFNAYAGRHCGGAAIGLAKAPAPDPKVAGSTCFSFNDPMFGFIANEPRCTYDRYGQFTLSKTYC